MVNFTSEQLGNADTPDRPDPLLRYRGVLRGVDLTKAPKYLDQPAVAYTRDQLRSNYAKVVVALKGVGGLAQMRTIDERQLFLAKAYALFEQLLRLGWVLDDGMFFVQALQDIAELPHLEEHHIREVDSIRERFEAHFDGEEMSAQEVCITRQNVLNTVRDQLISEDDYALLQMIKTHSFHREQQSMSPPTLRKRPRSSRDLRSLSQRELGDFFRALGKDFQPCD